MFYKLFFYIFFGLSALLTVFLCTTKPELHTALLVYDSSYEIVETETLTHETKKVSSTVKVSQAPTSEKKVVNVPKKEVTQVKVPVTTTKKTVAQTPKTTVTTAKNNTKVQTQPKVKTEKTVQKPVQQTLTKQTAPMNTQQTKTQTSVKQPVKQTMTSTQEEIEWNKWRSNIQNQIMHDVKLPILPQGTVFRFSFDVDKYGRITNVQTWSETPAFTPNAIQSIAPVIKSYQGRSILDFPQGSNRVTTTVTGHWRISTKQKYSNASNYNDIETVKKGY